MPRQKEKIWEHMEKVGPGNKIRCNYCKEEFFCSVTRMKFHLGRLAGHDIKLCQVAPDSVQAYAQGLCEEVGKKRRKSALKLVRMSGVTSTSSAGSTSNVVLSMMPFGTSNREGDQQRAGRSESIINDHLRKRDKEIVDLAIARFFVLNDIDFDVASAPEFIAAVASIANHGPGYIPPSSETIRTKLLHSWREEVDTYVKEVKESWAEMGCTIMLNGWKDLNDRNHIYLLASSIRGTIFICSESVKGKINDPKLLADFITRGIDEHVGRENVVQIIADNTTNYTTARHLLEEVMPHVLKTYCASQCLELMLEDIDREILKVRETVKKAKDIKNFIYKDNHVLNCMKVYAKGNELKRSTPTQFATNFFMLQSIIKQEEALRFMVASNEWRALSQTKSLEGVDATNLIQGTSFWEDGKEVIAVIEPLLKVLKMVDSERATLGYVYEAVDRAKETIAKYYEGVLCKYEPYWEIIDNRWNQLHHPLHALAALLNQHLYYDKFVKHDSYVDEGISIALQKMISTDHEREAFNNQLMDYIGFKSNLFASLAKMTIHSKHPSDWWRFALVVDKFSELQRVATRLLSQPCSVSACVRSWSAFEAALSKRRNILEQNTLNDPVFVRMNLHLKKINAIQGDLLKPIFLEHINVFPEQDELITDRKEIN